MAQAGIEVYIYACQLHSIINSYHFVVCVYFAYGNLFYVNVYISLPQLSALLIFKFGDDLKIRTQGISAGASCVIYVYFLMHIFVLCVHVAS